MRGEGGIWRDAAWAALLAFASACLVATGIWENGDIELKWWAVKAWADFQFPDFPANHHNMRWAITIPAAVFVRLFGDSPLSYLLLNHIVFALTTGGLYALMRQLTTPLAAALVLAVWLINPVAYSLPSNLMPEIYSMIYPVAALLLIRNAEANGSRTSYVAAVVMMFLAYGAKETNIFFMPGWGLYEMLRRRWDNVALMVGAFGACLLVETFAVNLVLSDSHLLFGRAEAILKAGHLNEMSTEWPYRFSDLLTRWGFIAETNLDRLEWFSKAIYLAFFAVTAWKGWEWARARTLLPPPSPIGPGDAPGGRAVSIAWAMGVSFAFFTTFFILSLDPLVLGQPLNDRYLWPLLVPASVVMGVVFKVVIEQSQAAARGPLAALGRLSRALQPFTQGRAALAALAVIAAFATLTRWPIEIATAEIRRQGFDHPYTIFTVNGFYANARDQLARGCTLVFTRPRPAQTILVHAFSFDEIEPTLALYRQQLDGLRINGRTLRAWPVPRSEWSGMEGKLHYKPEEEGFRPTAIRFEDGGPCAESYFYGNADLAREDQLMSAPVGPPPPRADHQASR